MDIVTHGVTGLLVARVATRDSWGIRTAAVLVGSLAPDLDVVARLWDPLASLTVHRVPTHSFLGALVLALVAAGLVRSLRGGGFWRLTALAYLGVLSHLVLDLFTPFGTVLLWPLDSRRWAVASLYMIDPTVVLVGRPGSSRLSG